MNDDASPKAVPVALDTSRMLAVPMTDSEVRTYESQGGTFGHYIGILGVVDHDKQWYLCFATSHNVQTLWRSGFRKVDYTPDITDTEPGFEVNGTLLEFYPSRLNGLPRGSDIWTRWLELQHEYNEYTMRGGSNVNVIRIYFKEGQPREKPLEDDPTQRAW